MSKGGVDIGNNVIIGPKVTMWTENHNFNSSKMIPYDEYDIPKPITIGDNVWIGLGVFICPGTKIGEGAIVGMGSVIRGDIPPLAIVFGNPAQIIGYRDEKLYRDIIENEGFYLKNKKEMNIERKNIVDMN
jgi:acetyltransferase-like isoleucine patch superfamily enzyme